MIHIQPPVTGLSLIHIAMRNQVFIFLDADANKRRALGFRRERGEGEEKRGEERGERGEWKHQGAIVRRLSLFAVHLRGLRRGLVGIDKPTETHGAKSKKFGGIVWNPNKGDLRTTTPLFSISCSQVHK